MTIVNIESVDRQAIMMALADLSLRRPEQEQFLRDVADKFAGRFMFEKFRELHRDLVKPDPPAVQSTKPA